ncbi:MAG TPA: hypothetical protein ENI22_02390 [Candidatus Pacearchaeota archaeon]|nr:hypothetical protein [Candidatus Pacearchaeota archaeon]
MKNLQGLTWIYFWKQKRKEIKSLCLWFLDKLCWIIAVTGSAIVFGWMIPIFVGHYFLLLFPIIPKLSIGFEFATGWAIIVGFLMIFIPLELWLESNWKKARKKAKITLEERKDKVNKVMKGGKRREK